MSSLQKSCQVALQPIRQLDMVVRDMGVVFIIHKIRSGYIGLCWGFIRFRV